MSFVKVYETEVSKGFESLIASTLPGQMLHRQTPDTIAIVTKLMYKTTGFWCSLLRLWFNFECFNPSWFFASWRAMILWLSVYGQHQQTDTLTHLTRNPQLVANSSFYLSLIISVQVTSRPVRGHIGWFCSAWGPPFRAQHSHSQPARPYSPAQGSRVSKYSTSRVWEQHRDMNTSQFLTAGHHNKHPGTKQGCFWRTDFEAFDPFALTCRCLNEHNSFQWDSTAAIMQKPNLGQLRCV